MVQSGALTDEFRFSGKVRGYRHEFLKSCIINDLQLISEINQRQAYHVH